MLKRKLSLIIAVSFFCLFIYTGISSLHFQKLAMYFPLTISILGMLMSVTVFFQELGKYRTDSTVKDEIKISNEKLLSDIKGTLIAFSWLFAYIILAYFTGFIIGSLIYLAIFLKFKAGFKIKGILISIVAMGIILYLLKISYLAKLPKAALDIFNFI